MIVIVKPSKRQKGKNAKVIEYPRLASFYSPISNIPQLTSMPETSKKNFSTKLNSEFKQKYWRRKICTVRGTNKMPFLMSQNFNDNTRFESAED